MKSGMTLGLRVERIKAAPPSLSSDGREKMSTESNLKDIRQTLDAKLQRLPESDLREVLNFVESLSGHPEEEDKPLLRLAGTLSREPISAEEVDEAVYEN
jgi:hypothetical protein